MLLSFLEWLRRSFLRKPILRFLVWLHNGSYHWISFFASYKGLHPKHDIQNYFKFFLDNIWENDNVLDIGSGNGFVAFKVSQKAKKVTGIDISGKNIKEAKSKYSQSNIKFIQGDATVYSFPGSFDAIILSNVLEHIKNRTDFLSKIKKLAPKILIRVPLITRDWVSVYKKNEGFEYRLDDTHYIEYTEEGFAEEMAKAGLEIENFYVRFGELYAVVILSQND